MLPQPLVEEHQPTARSFAADHKERSGTISQRNQIINHHYKIIELNKKFVLIGIDLKSIVYNIRSVAMRIC